MHSSLRKRKSSELESDTLDNFQVYVRVRPPQPTSGIHPELALDGKQVKVSSDKRSLVLTKTNHETYVTPAAAQKFRYDRVFDSRTSQSEVYKHTAKEAVESVLDGFNATVFAFGPTGTGKTYTMKGLVDPVEKGVIPRALEDVFAAIQQKKAADPGFEARVRVSHLQVYNEQISDLLTLDPKPLRVVHTPARVLVENLTEHVVENAREATALLQVGEDQRKTASTVLNQLSSRSHTIFTVLLETWTLRFVGTDGCVVPFPQLTPGDVKALKKYQRIRQDYRLGKLCLVDLAGSENLRINGDQESRRRETRTINLSLHALSRVIDALAISSSFVPFRESKLTQILRDSLGSNCRTTVLCTISSDNDSFSESLSTLQFADRAKRIRQDASVNEIDLPENELRREYKRLKHAQEVQATNASLLRARLRSATEEKNAAIDLMERMSSQLEALNAENEQLSQLLREGHQAALSSDPSTPAAEELKEQLWRNSLFPQALSSPSRISTQKLVTEAAMVQARLRSSLKGEEEDDEEEGKVEVEVEAAAVARKGEEGPTNASRTTPQGESNLKREKKKLKLRKESSGSSCLLM